MSERKVYPSDVTDAEWSVLEKVLPRAKATGRPRKHCLREMANAIFYLVRSGCPWRYLPEGYPVPCKNSSTRGFSVKRPHDSNRG